MTAFLSELLDLSAIKPEEEIKPSRGSGGKKAAPDELRLPPKSNLDTVSSFNNVSVNTVINMNQLADEPDIKT